jgi:hypothetical protein
MTDGVTESAGEDTDISPDSFLEHLTNRRDKPAAEIVDESCRAAQGFGGQLSLPETPIAVVFLNLGTGAGTVPGSMPAPLIALLAALRSLLRSRLELHAEILALRHQLAVLQREAPRPRLRPLGRLLWVLLSRLWHEWRRAVQIVTPDTVVRSHRQAFALAWRWRSRPPPAGATRPHRRPAHPDPADPDREPPLGRPAHPRRTPKARPGRLSGHRRQVPGSLARPSWTVIPDVADLTHQPRLPVRLL